MTPTREQPILDFRCGSRLHAVKSRVHPCTGQSLADAAALAPRTDQTIVSIVPAHKSIKTAQVDHPFPSSQVGRRESNVQSTRSPHDPSSNREFWATFLGWSVDCSRHRHRALIVPSFVATDGDTLDDRPKAKRFLWRRGGGSATERH
jgi:hypothetical protein